MPYYDFFSHPWTHAPSLLGVLLLSPFVLYYISSAKSQIPLINARGKFDLTGSKAKLNFVADAKNLLKAGFAKSDIFRLTSDNGIRLVLSPKYLNEIRNNTSLNFMRFLERETHTHIRGFEPFHQLTQDSEIFLDTTRVKLTQAQGKITRPLFEEAAFALRKNWTDDQDWHSFALKTSIERLVAQLSSKIFLGDELCRDEEWLRVTTDYARNATRAAEDLRLWPKIVRPIIALFLKSSRKIRSELNMARNILAPVLEKRRRARDIALKEGRVPEIDHNAMQWIDEIAKGRPYDPAVMQLGLATVAILTSADLLTQAILDICGKEKLIQELRDEIVTVLQEDGVKKTAMYKLHLMDSVLKESQRMKPAGHATFRRLATDHVKLNDGTEIAKGTALLIPNDWMRDSTFYENPETFDPYRFLKLRQVPGREHSAALVSVSPEHMGFGFGKHACPGRFFAANEIKIALCHILLKYDFKLADGTVPRIRRYGFVLQADPLAKLAVRRRREEISLEDLAD